MQIIMKRGMEELLRIAAGLPAPDHPPLEPWPRVHALNTLRVAFQDASLACDTSAFYARGEEGFEFNALRLLTAKEAPWPRQAWGHFPETPGWPATPGLFKSYL